MLDIKYIVSSNKICFYFELAKKNESLGCLLAGFKDENVLLLEREF